MAYADGGLLPPEAGLNARSPSDEFFRLGQIYSSGLGVSVDYVAAHKWFNIAASRGCKESRLRRREMVDELSSAELREAQRAAREWLRKAN